MFTPLDRKSQEAIAFAMRDFIEEHLKCNSLFVSPDFIFCVYSYQYSSPRSIYKRYTIGTLYLALHSFTLFTIGGKDFEGKS